MAAIKVVESKELVNLTDIDLLDILQLHNSVIFSRMSPEDKIRIVGLCKQAGWIVAVTGDGVNDSPALRKADIGVAM
ncbi:MAG: HAD-IC family P-type ATPase [Candidatus Peribacteria bacterium]|nr:MAG: HAD-IC family P-type ATPase [Candidatus Peribacteria bacterium]